MKTEKHRMDFENIEIFRSSQQRPKIAIQRNFEPNIKSSNEFRIIYVCHKKLKKKIVILQMIPGKFTYKIYA